MIRSRLILAALALTLSQSLQAMPACPSTWRLDFWAQTEQWPDVERTNDVRLLHGMTRELYDHCPRDEKNDALLTNAAEKFLRLTRSDPDQAYARQEAHFWLGMVYGYHAGGYDLDNRKADSALNHFIPLSDPDLRRRAAAQVQALRLRGARQLASIARYTQLNGVNLGKAGWNGSSQRVKCFLNTYPDMTGDEDVRPHLIWLSERAHDFIHDYSSDSRYDLTGMTLLAAEIDFSLAVPGAPREHWPTAEDLDPAGPANPRNCYRLPSPIPGPERFDFDFSKEGDEHRKAAAKARARALAVLDGTFQ
ncbi:MAG: hypothetical protein HY923_01750 [Elusimicrobia bacterium]|nr:hypothetical protein [Elusimicrobiota bacterium]